MSKKRLREGEYIVEKILDKKRSKYGNLYKIKWEGYPISDCTWEPTKHLYNVMRMVNKFNQTHQESRSSIEGKQISKKDTSIAPQQSNRENIASNTHISEQPKNISKEQSIKKRETTSKSMSLREQLPKVQRDIQTSLDYLIKNANSSAKKETPVQLDCIVLALSKDKYEVAWKQKPNSGRIENSIISFEQVKALDKMKLIEYFESRISFG